MIQVTRRLIGRVLLSACLLAIPVAASATSYKFTVSCETGTHVVEWRTGAIDIGKEAFRTTTGMDFPNCSVSHFQPSTDASYRVEVREGTNAVGKGLLTILSPFKLF